MPGEAMIVTLSRPCAAETAMMTPNHMSLVADPAAKALDRDPRIDIGFLVHPGLGVSLDRGMATIWSGDDALVRLSGRDLEVSLYEGSEAPARGWCSERFGTLSTGELSL